MRLILFLIVSFILSIESQENILFEKFPLLKKHIAYIPFANLPTPINKCTCLGKALGHNNIFIKRDDLTGFHKLYGGNKVRKLEFLLADALKKNKKTIITYGCVGSNHALATACYSKNLGLNCILMLKDQPNSCVVKQNLLLDKYFGANIHFFEDSNARELACKDLINSDLNNYFIPTGGSTKLGALGYVNAALELKKQIKAGIIPEPHSIYLPVGSCGTTAGLLLGFKIADIKSRIIAVTVQPENKSYNFLNHIEQLFAETNQFLNSYDNTIKIFEFPYNQLTINKDFCGEEYGLLIPTVDDASKLMKKQENINLENTYSAKAIAALIKDIDNNSIKSNEIILFWNTYCGLDFSSLLSTANYKQLPTELHHYFENCN